MTDTPDLPTALRRWASGSLPHKAAAEFLLGLDEVTIANLGIIAGDPHGNVWIEKTLVKVTLDSDNTLSGGERAIIALVDSLLWGELNEHYYRLDRLGQQAFRTAMLAQHVEVGHEVS